MAKKNGNGTDEPLEKQLWKAADKLRKNIDAAEYKHVVLGLIFLKYISDAFEELFAKLTADVVNGADPEDKDEYKAENVFFVPQDARWTYLQSKAKQPEIGKFVDDAMDAIEKENSSLKGVLPKVFARQNLDPTSLGELIDLVGNIALGSAKARSADVLGHVFEYFLGEFALAEGKQGGQFYTPRSIVELLVKMLEPYKGRVFDPCCGSGGMFVQSEKLVTEHQGKVNDISIYGQESNQTTWRLAKIWDAVKEKWNLGFSSDSEDIDYDFEVKKFSYNLQYYLQKTLGTKSINYLVGQIANNENPSVNALDSENIEIFKKYLENTKLKTTDWEMGNTFSGYSSESAFNKVMKMIKGEIEIPR